MSAGNTGVTGFQPETSNRPLWTNASFLTQTQVY